MEERERMLEKRKECWRKGKNVGERERLLENGEECWIKGKNVSYFILSLSISYPHIFSLSLYLILESNNVGERERMLDQRKECWRKGNNA